MRKTATCHRSPASSSGAANAGAPGLGQRWARFLAGVTAILVFAFAVIPGLQQVGPVREVHDAIQNSGIDATALFYTETEVSSEAESSIRNALRYPARRAAASGTPLRRE